MAYNKRILSEIDRELKDRYRSKRYSKSLAATNSLFAVNDLFAKPSRRRIYNPNAQYFQDGGSHDPPEKSKSLDEVTVAGSRKDPPLSYAQKLAAYNDSLAAYNWAKDNFKIKENHYKGDYDNLLDRALFWYDPKNQTNYTKWTDTNNDGYVDELIKGLTFEEYADKWRDKIDMKVKDFNVKPFTYSTQGLGQNASPDVPMYVKPTYPTKPTMKEAYKNVDKEKYPTFEDFEYAAEFYKEYGKNPDPSDLPSNRLPAPPPPEYEVEGIEPEIEIEKLDIIQPEFLSNDTELPELEERDEVEGVDYKIKRGPFIQPGLGGNPFGRFGSNYYRGPRLKWGSHRVPIEEEQLYPDEFIANMKFQTGGPINTSGPRAEEAPVDEDAMNAMMKARLAYEYEKGNPAAKRMVAPVDNPYDFGDGRTGTHYMSSYNFEDKSGKERYYAIPEIQDVDGTLEMTGPRDNEAIRFDREEDARYFANENYKRVSPMFINAELDDEEIQKYVDGGYIVEEMAEGGGVEFESCPSGQAWNGKYCVKIKNIVSDGKKVRVVPTPYEVENPSDDPLTQEFQSVDDIESVIKRGKKQGWSDKIVDKMICQGGNCRVLTIDDDTEIENIEPVKKRKPVKKNIIDTKQEVIEPEEDMQPEIEIERLPVMSPELIITDTSLPEELEEGENFNNDYKAKRVVDKIKMPKINKRGKIRRGPFGTKTTRSVRYEMPEAQKGGVAKAIKNISKNAKLITDAQPNIKKLASDIIGGKLARTVDAANRAIKDVKLGERSLGEILPITPSQKKAADLKAALAVEEGVNFNDSWFYEVDPKLGKILREDISDKILDIYEFSGPQNRLDKYFAQEFRGGGDDGFQGWGRLGLGEDVTGASLDNTLIYSGNKAGLNLENPLVQTSNILRPQGVRNILGSSLTDLQKKSVIRNYLADDTGGVNYPTLNLSVTNPGVGKIYRYPESRISDIALHEATHTAQRLGMPNRGFGEVLAKYDSDKGYFYPNEDTNIGRFFKEVMPDKDWVGSPNELHAELMVVRKKVFDNWINLSDVKEAFKKDPNTGRTLGISERDKKIKEWALEELRNPTNETLDGMLEMSGSSVPSLNKFFKKGVSKEKKYQALRYLPGLAVPFALPGLTDDDKPKLQKGGSMVSKIMRGIKKPISAPLTAFTKNELTPGKHLYRKIGNKKGLQDLIKQKGAKAPAPFLMKSGVRVDTPFFGKGDEPNNNYRGIFAVETDLPNKSKYDWSTYVGGVENYGVAPFDKIDRGLLDKVPLEDLNVYRKKWFSNNYKKLNKDNLDAGLKGARLQPFLENTFKWGTRGFLADQLFNDGDNTGGDLLGFQKGGALELGDEVTEDMVEELRRQGYTIEEI